MVPERPRLLDSGASLSAPRARCSAIAEPYEPDDGGRIWLDESGVRPLLEHAPNRSERTAYTLGVRSGLRVSVITDIVPRNVVRTSAGPHVRVWNSKGAAYWEMPTNSDLLATPATGSTLRSAAAAMSH